MSRRITLSLRWKERVASNETKQLICGHSTTIAIGFATKNASISRPVGWEAESWGYHGDDGRCFTGQNIGRPFGSPFNTGDVIGCGVNFRDHTAFFTKNGVKINGASRIASNRALLTVWT